MTAVPTARQLEETRMIRTWFDEAAIEVAIGGGRPPAPVEAVMRACAEQSFDEMAYRLGVPRALALFASVAFAAGRKAERAGLVHEKEAAR